MILNTYFLNFFFSFVLLLSIIFSFQLSIVFLLFLIFKCIYILSFLSLLFKNIYFFLYLLNYKFVLDYFIFYLSTTFHSGCLTTKSTLLIHFLCDILAVEINITESMSPSVALAYSTSLQWMKMA